jgi:predicted O-linked N-acetylglucosamine transferase (SPINDLY family)
VSYLGYAGTMGADFIDAVLCDEYVVPMDQQPYYREKIVHLPGCYLAQSNVSSVDENSLSRFDVGLPEKTFVFCAFHSPEDCGRMGESPPRKHRIGDLVAVYASEHPIKSLSGV